MKSVSGDVRNDITEEVTVLGQFTRNRAWDEDLLRV